MFLHTPSTGLRASALRYRFQMGFKIEHKPRARSRWSAPPEGALMHRMIILSCAEFRVPLGDSWLQAT